LLRVKIAILCIIDPLLFINIKDKPLFLFLDLPLLIIALGGLLAGFVNSAFATGGIYIQLAASLLVFSPTTAIALQAPLSFASLISRIFLFWLDLQWLLIKNFFQGCCIGVVIGALVFSHLSDELLLILLGISILFIIWLPSSAILTPKANHFTFIGITHSILGTVFGVGGVLQPFIFRTSLFKGQITGTLAAALLSLDILKIFSYYSLGFNYFDYWPHILTTSAAGTFGSLLGKRFSLRISESLFRKVFKYIVTIFSLQLIIGGVLQF